MENKYFGLLRNFDFNPTNSAKILEDLIALNIFILEFSLTGKDLEEERQWHIKNPNKKSYFGFDCLSFIFKENMYTYNSDIYYQMYELDKLKIEYYSETQDKILEIDYAIEREFQTEEKLRILEYRYNYYFNLIQNNKEEYLLYKNGLFVYEVNNWRDIYKEEITAGEDYKSVIDFLKGINRFYAVDIKETWKLLHKVSEICNYCELKKQQIENPQKSNLDLINSAKLIFASNGFEIFKLLLKNYKGEKNKAFYSYLYHYLLKKDLIINPVKDNKDYREFIYKNKYSPFKLSKTWVSEQDVNNKKENIFGIFKNILNSIQ
jgi:hypothetical protein